MKNIGKVWNSSRVGTADSLRRRLFSVHIRYLCLISLLMIFSLLCLYFSRVSTEKLRLETESNDRQLAEILYSGFTEAADRLRAAQDKTDPTESRSDLSVALSAVERMKGALQMETADQGQRLERYLNLLSEECRRMEQIANPEKCRRLADQLDRLTEDGIELFYRESAGSLELRLSPYLSGSGTG
ncbi:MAG: hypothetical protein ACI3YK_01895 [Eubacteriales bacterium]